MVRPGTTALALFGATGAWRRRCLRRLTGVALACALAPMHVRADEIRRFDLKLVGRRLAAGAVTLRVTQGDTVEIRWTTDQAVELHLHGYDIALAITPSGAVVMRVQASLTGRFPIAVHGEGRRHAPIAYLEVHPR